LIRDQENSAQSKIGARKDLSCYALPELEYRKKTMASIAGFSRLNGLCFTAEEFPQLWSTKYSDCVDIDCWHAPTAYDILELMQQNQSLTKEEIIDTLKQRFSLDNRWEKLMNKYWDKVDLFTC